MLKKALQPALTGVEIKVASPFLEFVQAPSVVPPVFKGERLVIYGFLKSKDEKSAICTLQGQFLGEKVQHQIKFSLDTAPRSGFNLPIIHQLAAKRLLQEWDTAKGTLPAAAREQKRAEAVDFSIKSGVLCSSTAFVAINEEEQKPIEGAVTVWNLEAAESAPSFIPHSLAIPSSGRNTHVPCSRKRPAGFSPGKQVNAVSFPLTCCNSSLGYVHSLRLKQQERVHQQKAELRLLQERK